MKTFLKAILSLLILLFIVSCKETPDRKPDAVGTSYATLIAYSIHDKHKHSDATLQLNKIGTIHNVTLPRRTQPKMALGDSTKVNYVVYGNHIEISECIIETKPYTTRGYFYLNK
jgi:hypothetical protein